MPSRSRAGLPACAAFGALALLLGAAFAGAASAGPIPAQIGVFFDADAALTTQAWDPGSGQIITAYVAAAGAEQLVGGAAYKLSYDPWLQLTSVTYPEGSFVGDPSTTGVEVTFTDCHDGTGAAVLISTLTFLPSTSNQWTTAGIGIQAHPGAGTIRLFDCNGIPREVAGGLANVTYVVAVEPQTWGAVKSLYSR